MTDPIVDPPADPRSPVTYVAVVLAAVAATLLLGGVLFAFANADAQRLGDADRFRLLGQAANPFIAFLGLVAVALVVRGRETGVFVVAAPKAAVVLATAVSVAVILLAVNGILTDITGGATALFRVSAVVSRLGTIGLSAFALWIAGASKPSGT